MRRLWIALALLLALSLGAQRASAQVSTSGQTLTTSCGTTSAPLFNSNNSRTALYIVNYGQGPGPVYICIGAAANSTTCAVGSGIPLYPGWSTPLSWVNAIAATIPKSDVSCIADSASQTITYYQQ